MVQLPEGTRNIEVEMPNDFHPGLWKVKLAVKVGEHVKTFWGQGQTCEAAQNHAVLACKRITAEQQD